MKWFCEPKLPTEPSHFSVRLVAPCFQLVAVAGFIRLIVQREHDIGAARIRQSAKEVAIADLAGRQGAAMRLYVGDQGFQQPRALIGFRQVHHKRDGAAGLRPGCVNARRWIEEMPVE